MARSRGTTTYRLLAVMAFLFALFSVFLLDAPWASNGIGAVLIWLIILDLFALAGALALSAKAISQWRWSRPRAAILPLIAVAGLVLLEGAVHEILHRCVFW